MHAIEDVTDRNSATFGDERFRPLDKVVGGRRFYRDSICLSIYLAIFFRWLPSERFENVCPKSGVSPYPKSRGPKTTSCRQLPNLTATLTAYIIQMKHDIHNRKLQVSPTSPQNVVNFGPQTA